MGEQTKAEKAADAGSFQSMVVGAQQLVNGLTGMAAAGQMEAAAKKVKRMEGISFSVRPMTPGQLTAGDVLAPRTATAIGGNGQADTTNAVDEQKTEDLADLGAPVPDGLSPEGLQNAAPTAQKFVGKDPGDAKGGGGPASMSVGSTSANTGAGETPSGPTAASNAGSTAYQGGAGGGYQGGGGGGAAGGKDPDLSSMLAQFLPKKEDEVGQNGILDYGGRSPASDESASLLDRNANIFERIHQTYQSKQKAKSVGI
ncbi:MAG: hypothetical protein NDJ89_15970 [Oligoflexia bacterium]|nr:hypothetical protein [Oligoflexia bacterium]